MTADSPLIQAALAALHAGATVALDDQALLVEERNTWQPESWLIQRCGETLADAGLGSEALTVANQLASRRPLARLQALYRLTDQLQAKPAIGPLIQHELQQWHHRLFHTHTAEANDIERLLLVATSAALAGEIEIAASCLERMDNIAKGWQRVVARAELREQLALTIVHIGPHPLTNDLINVAVRRFDDAGAQLLLAITTLLQAEITRLTETGLPGELESAGAAIAKAERMMRACLDTLHLSTLVSLQSRRIAAIIFGQAGEVDEVLTQLATIESVQTAQRETGYAPAKEETSLLRQVKRTSANRDVDFLVYTLRNAIDVMPLHNLRRAERIALADKLALLGTRSDGWTAASAIDTLVELGALHYAIQVVDHIAPHDPSRSEGLLMLVRSLMKLGERQIAAEQARRALDWAESLEVRNPERALTWGLAEIYLQYHQPLIAIQLLERWREPVDWRARLRRFWGKSIDDDDLRNRRLRLHALLQLEKIQSDNIPVEEGLSSGQAAQPTEEGNIVAETHAPQQSSLTPFTEGQATTTQPMPNLAQEIPSLLRSLRRAASQLLEGEALVHFYVDGLLQPLLDANRQEDAWALLPDLRRALLTTSGSKLAARIAEIAALLSHELSQTGEPQREIYAAETIDNSTAKVRHVIDGFLRDLWRESAERGLWQVVHSIEGALPLLLVLEGPSGMLAIAQALNGKTVQEVPQNQ